MNGGEDYELVSHLNGGYCDEEEEYQLISDKSNKEGAPYPGQDHGIPLTQYTSPKVISRNTSPSGFYNLTVSNSGTRNQLNSHWRNF